MYAYSLKYVFRNIISWEWKGNFNIVTLMGFKLRSDKQSTYYKSNVL